MSDWWQNNGSAGEPPDRTALDPLALKLCLPNLMVSEASAEPLRIRYRLVGTKICEVAGFDFTGRYLDEVLSGAQLELWTERYRLVKRTRRPIFGDATAATTANQIVTYEFGIFPLRVGGSDIKQFVAIEDYFQLRTGLRELHFPPSPSSSGDETPVIRKPSW